MRGQETESEILVRRLLEKQDFKCCYEPYWITGGKKPDYFCFGPANIWVEVKSLGQTDAEKKATRLCCWFDKRRQINRPGARINAIYSREVTDKDVKESLNRVRRLLKQVDCTKYDHLVVTIPRNTDFQKDTEFFLFINDQHILIISARSRDGCYGCSFIDSKVRIYRDHLVQVREADSEWATTAGQLGLDGEDLRLAVIVIPSADREISLSGLSEIGDAEIGWPDAERFRNGAKDAAKKFKNAMSYKCVPSIIFWVVE